MNEIKKSLIKVAGDLSENKVRVRENIYKQHEKKQNYKKNLFSGIGAVALIGVLFLVTSFLINQQNDDLQLATAELFDDQIFNFDIKLNKVMGFNSDESRLEHVYENYEKDLAIYTYALSHGYEISETEMNEIYNRNMEVMFGSEESKKFWNDTFSQANITMAEFEEHLSKTSPYDGARRYLEEHYIKLYPKIDTSVANSLAVKHALPYFREHFADEIKRFKEKHDLPLYNSPIWEGQKKIGRVVAFEDNMFLVVPDATVEDIQILQTEEILEKHLEAYWYPQDEIPNLNVGDLIEVYGKTVESSRSPFVSDIWNVKMIDAYQPDTKSNNTIQLTIDKENISRVKTFVSILNWEEMKLEFTNSPNYKFEVDDIVYEIWSYSDGFVLYSSKGEYRKINEDFSIELAGYLGIGFGEN
ncbi:DUF3221 domain-containing protein [Ureibacillus acetophenoni]|uniref:Uncharacterized protein n=1 Tax=Ureibacillus acetophenoni TaxID=614649 RepID=A0A285U5B8_9BACL|nr:DUF3221 domain-containing protein [Ureibacillus acetophenoni]SOC37125.1 hypothetical protein SAMN05877842_10356 [Ureibacillus acetophenoni]